MSHRTLVSGTAYNVTGGKSMVSGTAYNVVGGKTLVGGTGYNISFGGGEPTAMLYSDGNMVFQLGSAVESGKTLTASYTGFEDASYANAASVPWNAQRVNIKNVRCENREIMPVSIAYWFRNCSNMMNFDFANFNMENVTTMYYAYYNCFNLTGSPVCGNSVTNMYSAYENCRNLTGSPVCGNSVTNMYSAYENCRNLTGSPVCGNSVTNMYYAYFNCSNLTGSPVCGNSVTTMGYAYYGCFNLTGSPVCGNKVTSMYYAYFNCSNLTGSPVCGNSVTNMYYAYRNCKNIASNGYFYSSTVKNVGGCFYGKNNSRRLNLYVPANSTTNTTVHYNNTFSLVGANITWTTNDTCSYNTAYNIYIYPVANVAASAIANGDEEANANAGIVISDDNITENTGGAN